MRERLDTKIVIQPVTTLARYMYLAWGKPEVLAGYLPEYLPEHPFQ